MIQRYPPTDNFNILLPDEKKYQQSLIFIDDSTILCLRGSFICNVPEEVFRSANVCMAGSPQDSVTKLGQRRPVVRFVKAMTLLAAVFTVVAAPVLARVCPVTGQLAADNYFVDYNGNRVFFSCKLAKQDFLAGPEQYLETLKEVNNAEKKAQAICPVSNEGIDRTVWADYSGKRIYLHCKLAKKSFQNNPEVYYRKLVEGNVTLEDAPPLDLRFIVASEGAGLAN
jgi:YHS domain-containing protein